MMTGFVLDPERCRAEGLDPEKVDRLAAKLSKLLAEADKMGLYLFGGSGSGTLRLKGQLRAGEIATVNGYVDGGCGSD